MGCCGTSNVYPEIDEAESIEELYNNITSKSKECEEEIEQITNYLKDRSRIPTKFDVASQSDETLKKRIGYLQDYITSLQKVSSILGESPNMDLKQTIAQCHSLYDCYYLQEDTNNVLGQIINNLNTLASYSK